MGKKTILRIAEGLELSKAFETNLEMYLGKFQIERYSPVPDFTKSYLSRMESLDRAFHFIIKTIELRESPEWLETYANWCLKHYSFLVQDKGYCVGGTNPDTLQPLLFEYTTLIISALLHYYPWKPEPIDLSVSTMFTSKQKEFVIELLNKAEQYVLTLEGRGDLATLIATDIHETPHFILQLEKQLAPYTPQTLHELVEIKNNPLITSPSWFRKLPSDLQIYIHFCASLGLNFEEIISNFNEFNFKWHELLIKQYAMEADLPLINSDYIPGWFSDLSPIHQELMKLLCATDPRISGINKQLVDFRDKTMGLSQRTKDYSLDSDLAQLGTLPYWSLILKGFEQRFLKEILISTDSVEEAVSFAPSRSRRVPWLPNLCEHLLHVLDERGISTISYPSRLRSSHLASRDVVNFPPIIGLLHAKRNLEKIKSLSLDNPLMVQTLISPVKPLKSYIPDYELDEKRKTVVALLKKETRSPIFSTNHPFNIAKLLYPTDSADPDCNYLLNFAKIMLLAKEIPPIENELDLAEIEDAVQTAWARLKGRKSEGEIAKSLTSRNETLTNQLIDIFNTHEGLLNKVSDWQHQFASMIYSHKSAIEISPEGWKPSLDDLEKLVEEYYAVLYFGAATFGDYNGRELFLSSLENLIVMHINGISYGSCVSGKDRKAIELIHTDAMLIYRMKYGVWPSLSHSERERENFVKIVGDLYLSRHAHTHAGQNAPGSEGIKSPKSYWPEDIATYLKKRRGEESLGYDDRLASNNEVNKIGKIKDNLRLSFGPGLMTALKLSPDKLTAILDELKILGEERSFFRKLTFIPISMSLHSSPTGIANIQEILNKPVKTRAGNVYKLAEIFYTLNNRPKDSPWRSPKTQQMYNIILDLYQAKDPNSQAEAVLESLGKIKHAAFKANTCS